MKIKRSQTSDFLTIEEVNKLLRYLSTNNLWKYYLLVKVGIKTGLRYSDLQKIRWYDLLKKETITIEEKKTKKIREIPISNELKSSIESVADKIGSIDIYSNVFNLTNRCVNIQLKKYCAFAKISSKKQISTHSFRKTLGREVWSRNNYSEQSLIQLSHLFQHSSIAITRIYLGITKEEVQDLYAIDDIFTI